MLDHVAQEHPQLVEVLEQRLLGLPLAEDADLLVQAAAQPGDLVLANVVQAHLLGQPVDLAGGDAVDVGLLHHRDQRLLGTPAGSKKLGKQLP